MSDVISLVLLITALCGIVAVVVVSYLESRDLKRQLDSLCGERVRKRQ